MIASLIFSIMISGFAAIYTTAFSQGGAVTRDSRLRTSAMIAFKGMNLMLVGATRLDQPGLNSSGNVLRGCRNFSPDGVRHTLLVPVDSFAYCVQPGGIGGCGTVAAPAPCLFSYRWNGCPAPAVSAGNCGANISGAVPDMLSPRVLYPALPATQNHFIRLNSQAAGNQIHIQFVFQRDATGKIPTLRYEINTVAHTQVDGRL